MVENFKPADVIAMIAIIGGFALLALGVDGTVSAVILSIAAYYFGKSTTEHFYHKKNNGN